MVLVPTSNRACNTVVCGPSHGISASLATKKWGATHLVSECCPCWKVIPLKQMAIVTGNERDWICLSYCLSIMFSGGEEIPDLLHAQTADCWSSVDLCCYTGHMADVRHGALSIKHAIYCHVKCTRTQDRIEMFDTPQRGTSHAFAGSMSCRILPTNTKLTYPTSK